MENLRWILLAAGIIFILAIYLFGRNRRSGNSSDLFDAKEDLPDFSARDWDELDEGVGEVRIVARDDEYDSLDEFPSERTQADEDLKIYQDESALEQDDLFVPLDEVETSPDEPLLDESGKSDQAGDSTDIVVLYILAKPSNLLSGDKINSAAQANGLSFGQMNIFHRLDADEKTVFSLANMVEPGNFDPDSIHEMTTTGLTVFMQLSDLSNPADDFDEMLRCSYHISEMLGATLCNQYRQPITQADAEYYRNLISQKQNT
ncbi:MAG: hypothetical protein OQK69_06530 [Gammaproteobacteria bacterium]|nr:hypothetical protein [Gammaproteobacteria bacterium]